MAVIHSENLTYNDSRSTLAKYELPWGLHMAARGERTMSGLDKPAGPSRLASEQQVAQCGYWWNQYREGHDDKAHAGFI